MILSAGVVISGSAAFGQEPASGAPESNHDSILASTENDALVETNEEP